MQMLKDVQIKALVTHCDERGYFREIIRKTDPLFAAGFGQWSVSRMNQGVIKAWHLHQVQWDWWYVGGGTLKVGLYDTRVGSETFGQTQVVLMGDPHPAAVLAIPPGVAHGCKVLQGPSHLFYITSQVYDPNDEGRIPYDDVNIGFDWLALPPIT